MFKTALAAAILFALGGGASLALSSYGQDNVEAQAMLPSVVASEGEPFVDHFPTHNQEAWAISGGWANGRYMVNDWRRSQTRIDDGLAIMIERQSGADYAYTSGEMQSRALYGHGYYEVTLQAARGSGLISGFFTYTGPPFGRPWNEIDVEILGKNTQEAVLTYHFQGDSRSETIPLAFDAATGLHHYAFDWQPGHIRWYIEGELVFEETGSELPLPDEPQKIMAHLWGTERLSDWAGPFDRAAIPAVMRVGCVAYSLDRSDGDRCR